MSETYISVDIEADGPIPGLNSMLSLGAAAFDKLGNLISTFSANILPLIDAEEDPDTMKWWSTQPAAWAALQKDRKHAVDAMREFVEWQKQFGDRKVFIAWPLSFEAMFVGWYLQMFAGAHPFSFKWADIDSYAAGVLKIDIGDTRGDYMPRTWAVDDPHTHVAVEDAIQQGRIFMKIVRQVRGE